jgi:hypothetical protein
MENAKELLLSYVEQTEKIIIEFKYNEDNAVSLLKALKSDLEKKVTVEKEQKELYEVCVYNALATINTSFEQEKNNRQLLMALTEAKEEMKAIVEFL